MLSPNRPEGLDIRAWNIIVNLGNRERELFISHGKAKAPAKVASFLYNVQRRRIELSSTYELKKSVKSKVKSVTVTANYHQWHTRKKKRFIRLENRFSFI